MFPRETPGRAAKAAARSLETWGAGWRASSGRGSREAPFQASLLSGVDLGESGRSKSRGKAATSWARHWPRSPPLCPSSAPPTPRAPGPGPRRQARKNPGVLSEQDAPAAGRARALCPRLTSTLDRRAAPRGRGTQASATRRLKLCCSRDGAVVTSSPSERAARPGL